MSTLKVNTLTDTAATKSVPIEDVVNGTARAWVNFDGTFGTSPFTVANGGIRAAYNVSSVTDNNTGDYTVNFTNAMPDANYSVEINGTVRGNTSSSGGSFQIQNISGGAPTTPALMSTTQIRIGIKSSASSGSWDSPTICVSIHR